MENLDIYKTAFYITIKYDFSEELLTHYCFENNIELKSLKDNTVSYVTLYATEEEKMLYIDKYAKHIYLEKRKVNDENMKYIKLLNILKKLPSSDLAKYAAFLKTEDMDTLKKLMAVTDAYMTYLNGKLNPEEINLRKEKIKTYFAI